MSQSSRARMVRARMVRIRTVRIRTALAYLTLLIPPLVIFGTWLTWKNRLPSEIATHWSGLGKADQFSPTNAVFLGVIVFSSITLVVGIVLLILPQVSQRRKRTILFWTGYILATVMGIWLISAGTTIHAGSAQEAILGPWLIVPLICMMYSLVPYFIAPRSPLEDKTFSDQGVKPLDLAPTEVVVWSQTLSSRLFFWLACATGVLGLFACVRISLTGSSEHSGIFFFAFLVTLFVSILFAKIRITIDWRGLRLTSATLHVPLKRIPLNRIRSVEIAELNPWEWGGWGYRIKPGQSSAFIMKKGPGLVLTTANQKKFAISLPNPGAPAALLVALIPRSNPSL